jgi:hypothetical protein
VIADAERPLRTLSATAPLQRAEIARNRHGLEALAAVLETGDPLPVRGTAAVQLFLTHAESPLYTPSAANALEDAIARSQAALLEG